MKKVIFNISALFILIVYITFSTGIVVTIHECCTKHHHEASEHNHCHNSTLLLKISETSDTSVFSAKTVAKVFQEVITVLRPETALESLNHIILKENRKLPPLVILEGKEVHQFHQQWVYYA